MNLKIVSYLAVFIVGFAAAFFLFNSCNKANVKALEEKAQHYKDTTAIVAHGYDSLRTLQVNLSVDKLIRDSAYKFHMDSLLAEHQKLKKRYSQDTLRFRDLLISLKEAFKRFDTARVYTLIDSLTIEAQSATWAANNLIYDCEQRDSIYRHQKAYYDSLYANLLDIDHQKDLRFAALITINNQMGVSLDDAIKQLKKEKNAKVKWGIAGIIIGALTNFLHK